MSNTQDPTGSADRWNADRDAAARTLDREGASAREAASQAAGSIRDQAASLASGVRESAEAKAEGGLSAAASSLDDFTAAIRKASDELGERDQSMAAQIVREAASGLEQASGALKGKSVGEVTQSLAGFARRQPAAFLVGATLAGIALGRFARASSDHSDTAQLRDAVPGGASQRARSGSIPSNGLNHTDSEVAPSRAGSSGFESARVNAAPSTGSTSVSGGGAASPARPSGSELGVSGASGTTGTAGLASTSTFGKGPLDER